jgi:hypothetical protein
VAAAVLVCSPSVHPPPPHCELRCDARFLTTACSQGMAGRPFAQRCSRAAVAFSLPCRSLLSLLVQASSIASMGEHTQLHPASPSSTLSAAHSNPNLGPTPSNALYATLSVPPQGGNCDACCFQRRPSYKLYASTAAAIEFTMGRAKWVALQTRAVQGPLRQDRKQRQQRPLKRQSIARSTHPRRCLGQLLAPPPTRALRGHAPASGGALVPPATGGE